MTASKLDVLASGKLVFLIDANDDGLAKVFWLDFTVWPPSFFRHFCCVVAFMFDVSSVPLLGFVSSGGSTVASVEQPGFGSPDDSVWVDEHGVNGGIVAVDVVDIGVDTTFSILRLFFASMLISVSTLVRDFSSDDSRFDVSMSVSSSPDDGMSSSNVEPPMKSTLLFKFSSGMFMPFSTFSVVADGCCCSSSVSFSL